MKNTFTKIFSVIILSILFLSVSLTSYAVFSRYYDEPGLLNETDTVRLLSELDSYSEEAKFDICIFAYNDMMDKGYNDIKDFFKWVMATRTHNYGSEVGGIYLVISMANRDFCVDTYGSTFYKFTESEIDYIVGSFLSYLSAGNYYQAFHTFASISLSYGLNDTFEKENFYKETYRFKTSNTIDVVLNANFKPLLICPLIGLIFSFIIVSAMSSQLTSVKLKNQANDYFIKDSLNLTEKRDIYLYSNVVTVPKPKNTGKRGSYHRSGGGGGGGSHGRSGKF